MAKPCRKQRRAKKAASKAARRKAKELSPTAEKKKAELLQIEAAEREARIQKRVEMILDWTKPHFEKKKKKKQQRPTASSGQGSMGAILIQKNTLIPMRLAGHIPAGKLRSGQPGTRLGQNLSKVLSSGRK